MICSTVLFSLVAMQATTAWERPVVSVNVVLDVSPLKKVLRGKGEDPALFESQASDQVANLFQTKFPHLEFSTKKDAAWHLQLILAPACEANDQKVDIELDLHITGPEDVYRSAAPWLLFRSYMPLRGKTVDSLVKTVTTMIRKQLKELRPVARVMSLIPVAREGAYDSVLSMLIVGLREQETGLSLDTEFGVLLNCQTGTNYLRVVAVGTHACGERCFEHDRGLNDCFATQCRERDLDSVMSIDPAPDVDTVYVTLPVLSWNRKLRKERSRK